MIDYHLHTYLSGDAPGSTVLAMCERAVEMGLTEIAFTEHLDFDPSDNSYGAYDYRVAREEIEQASDRFGERLTIRLGVECDYQTRFRSRIEDYLADKQFDFVLGSAHYVDGMILDNPDYFDDKLEEEAYLPYFDVAEAVALSGLFDAFSHLEFCKRRGVRRFGPFGFEKYKEQITRVLRIVAAKNMALEINSSGLRQDPRETYPSLSTVKLFRQLGGKKITIGSDAHRVEHVGFGVKEGLGLALQAGFTEIATFENRACRPMPIQDPGRGL